MLTLMRTQDAFAFWQGSHDDLPVRLFAHPIFLSRQRLHFGIKSTTPQKCLSDLIKLTTTLLPALKYPLKMDRHLPVANRAHRRLSVKPWV